MVHYRHSLEPAAARRRGCHVRLEEPLRKQGFISHIHEESAIARYIKDWYGSIFLGQLDLFVSSIDVAPGNWLEQVRRSLRRSAFVFPLLSKRSVARPWINFESGSAFMADNVELIPLCHKDLLCSELDYPYSAFQAYDLRQADHVFALVQFLARELDLNTPPVNAAAFAAEINRLDRELYQFYHTLEELRIVEGLREDLQGVDSLLPLPVSEIEIWDELELRARIYDNLVVEASGYTRDTMGFNVHDLVIPSTARYLVVGLEQTDNSVSHDTDKFLKIILDRQIAITKIGGNAHYEDEQYTIKGDGLFVYDIPYSARHAGRIGSLNVTFWKIELQNVLIRLFVV